MSSRSFESRMENINALNLLRGIYHLARSSKIPLVITSKVDANLSLTSGKEYILEGVAGSAPTRLFVEDDIGAAVTINEENIHNWEVDTNLVDQIRVGSHTEEPSVSLDPETVEDAYHELMDGLKRHRVKEFKPGDLVKSEDADNPEHVFIVLGQLSHAQRREICHRRGKFFVPDLVVTELLSLARSGEMEINVIRSGAARYVSRFDDYKLPPLPEDLLDVIYVI